MGYDTKKKHWTHTWEWKNGTFICMHCGKQDRDVPYEKCVPLHEAHTKGNGRRLRTAYEKRMATMKKKKRNALKNNK